MGTRNKTDSRGPFSPGHSSRQRSQTRKSSRPHKRSLRKAGLKMRKRKCFAFKYLGVMHSGDDDPLVPVNHRIEFAWVRCINFKLILTSQRLPGNLRFRLFKASVMSAILYGCQSSKFTTHMRRKLIRRYPRRFQESRERRRRGPHTVNQYSNEYARLPVELSRAHITHGRGQIRIKVHLNCVKPEKE